MLKALQTKNLSAYSNLKHGFFTRQGGCSTGLLSSLNMRLSTPNEEKNFQENCRRVCEWFHLPTTNLCLMNQVHGDQVCWIDDHTISSYPIADALLTREPGLILGVRTADCVPILLYDPQESIYGVVHVGWRGAQLNILKKTFNMMTEQGSCISNIVVSLGPCIQMESFEVGIDVYKSFQNINDHYEKFFKIGKDSRHFWFDLPGLVLTQLASFGIKNIESLNIDTYQDEENFFSYRRTQHTQASIYATQISAISFKETL